MTVNVFLAIPAAHTRWHPACVMRNAQQPHHCSQWLLPFSFQQTGSHPAAKRQNRTERKKRTRSHKYGVSRKHLLETEWNLWVKSTVCSLPRDPPPFTPPGAGWFWAPQCHPWICFQVSSLAGDDKGLGKASFLTGNQKILNTNKKCTVLIQITVPIKSKKTNINQVQANRLKV